VIDGIDVSRHQSTTPALGGLSFAFARATYGSYGDSKYAVHSAAFRAAGIVAGAYHFGRSTPSPELQVAAFLKAAGGADLLALDLESDGGNVPMSAAQARAFIAAVHAAGRKIGLYHSRSGFPSLGQDWNWVAKWGSAAPTGIPWAFWQWQGSPLDRNRFNGTLADLNRLGGRAPAPAVAPKESNVLLRANAASPVQTLVDVKKDDWVYRLDGTRLIQWSANYTVTSLGGSGIYDLIVVTTNKVTQYALILTSATTNRRPVGATPPATPPAPVVAPPPPPPVVTPPSPVVPPISTTPEHVGALQPPPWGFMTYGYFGETMSPNGLRAWLARSQTMAGYAAASAPLPVFVLLHGGPKPLGEEDGTWNLANWLAARGAVAVAIDYPTRSEDGQWTDSVAAIRSAIAAVRGKAASWGGDPSRITLVCHSFGGFFGELVAFTSGEVDRLVLVATEDRANEEYRASVGNPPDPLSLMASSARKVPTTVITGSADLVATVAEHQALVADLAASGHPGRWVVIDGANHNSILSDVGAIAAIMGG
jgi:lysozyme